MSNISKGPWDVRPGNNSKSVHNLIIEGDMTSIATVHGSVDCAVDWYAGASHLEANARLIAAAPDLLEALEGLLNNEKQASFEFWLSRNRPSGDCESVHSQWLESSEYHDFLDLYDSEITAIAKARGES